MVVYRKNGRMSSERRQYWQESEQGVKELGNMPKKWCFDKKHHKLYMLFTAGSSKYLIMEKARLTHDFGGYVMGILNSNNHGFILRNSAHCRLKQIIA